MDKKDKNVFEPMGGMNVEFTNLDELIEYGKTQGILVDDSMNPSDKIKMLTAIMSLLMFDKKTGVVNDTMLGIGVSIIYEYIGSIPNNSIEILNAKNEFKTIINTIGLSVDL